jgi:hypothetical protein
VKIIRMRREASERKMRKEEKELKGIIGSVTLTRRRKKDEK